MSYMIVAAGAVPVESSSNGLAVSMVAVLLGLLAVAVPVALLVGLVVMAGRVRRSDERLAQVEARLAAVEGRRTVGE